MSSPLFRKFSLIRDRAVDWWVSEFVLHATIGGGNLDQINGNYSWIDGGGNTVADVCTDTCPSDATGDGVVNASDINEAIDTWGSCAACDADVNGDAVVRCHRFAGHPRRMGRLLLMAMWISNAALVSGQVPRLSS